MPIDTLQILINFKNASMVLIILIIYYFPTNVFDIPEMFIFARTFSFFAYLIIVVKWMVRS